MASASSPEMIPCAASIRAWAREAARSWGQRRRSTLERGVEAVERLGRPGREAPAPRRAPSLMPRRRPRRRGPAGRHALGERPADAVDLGLGHLGEEGQRDRGGADRLGHRELAGPVPVDVPVEGLQVDAGQVGLGRDADGVEVADDRVAVQARVERGA